MAMVNGKKKNREMCTTDVQPSPPLHEILRQPAKATALLLQASCEFYPESDLSNPG